MRGNKFIARTCIFTKDYLKWLTLPKKLLLDIFQGFCLKVLGDLIYRTPPLCSKQVVHGLFKIIQIYVNNKMNY